MDQDQPTDYPMPNRISPADFQRGFLNAGHQRQDGTSGDAPRIPTPRPISAADFARGMRTVDGSAATGKTSSVREPVSPEEALGLVGPRARGDYGSPTAALGGRIDNKDDSAPQHVDMGGGGSPARGGDLAYGDVAQGSPDPPYQSPSLGADLVPNRGLAKAVSAADYVRQHQEEG